MEPGAYDIETTVVANSHTPVAVKHEHASSHELLASVGGLELNATKKPEVGNQTSRQGE